MSSVLMKVVNSSELLREEGYDYFYFEEEPVEPELTDVRFSDVLPELLRGDERCVELAGHRLYKHQLEAYNALSSGKNVVLVSGTGSGKTESWALYALRNRIRTLVVYPTLALTEDQYQRLVSYLRAVDPGRRVARIDAAHIKSLTEEHGGVKARSIVAKEVTSSLILLTNPAFLLADLKRLLTRGTSWLSEFVRSARLLVIDELDFYGSSRASLLIAMVGLVARFARNLQVAVLGATIGGIEDLVRHLERVTGREAIVIRGRPFRVRNRWFILLGRNLRPLWEKAVEIIRANPSLSYLEQYVREFEEFKKYFVFVIEELRRAGFHLEEPYIEFERVLARYVEADEDGVTIVFCPSIRSAERLAARTASRLPLELRERVAVHHHLVPKSTRVAVEEGLRSGRIKLVFTVRTLLQGIDIGSVVRVVHYGLPRDVRELRQREGRKGRRREIPFTESILLPVFPWDRELVSLGPEWLRRWLSQEVEGVYLNLSNGFVKLFQGYVRYFTERRLTDEELELMKSLRLVETRRSLYGVEYVLSGEGRRFWLYLNFYEFGPPYGVPRYLKRDGELTPLEEVSHRDLVEKFQPYTFDLSNEAMVVEVDPRRGVIEMPITALEVLRDEALEYAVRQYAYAKLRWGERPDLRTDVVTGRLQSLVAITIRTPAKGFGIFVEEPIYVKWVIESSRPRPVRVGDRVMVIYPRESIEVPAPCRGRYRGLTYGYVVDLPPIVSVDAARVAAAALQVAFRISRYRIPLGEVSFEVQEHIRSRPVVLAWEPEPAGILVSVDWREIERAVESLGTDPLHFILLRAVDDEAAIYFADRMGGDWDGLKPLVKTLLRHLAREIAGVVPELKPVIGSGRGVVTLFIEKLELPGRTVWCLASSGRAGVSKLCVSAGPPCGEVIEGLKSLLDTVYGRGYILAHFGQGDLLREVAEEDRTLGLLLEALEKEGAVVDLYAKAREVYGDELTLSQVVAAVARHVGARSSASIPRCTAGDPERCANEIRRWCTYLSRALYVFATGMLPPPAADERAGN